MGTEPRVLPFVCLLISPGLGPVGPSCHCQLTFPLLCLTFQTFFSTKVCLFLLQCESCNVFHFLIWPWTSCHLCFILYFDLFLFCLIVCLCSLLFVYFPSGLAALEELSPVGLFAQLVFLIIHRSPPCFHAPLRLPA